MSCPFPARIDRVVSQGLDHGRLTEIVNEMAEPRASGTKEEPELPLLQVARPTIAKVRRLRKIGF